MTPQPNSREGRHQTPKSVPTVNANEMRRFKDISSFWWDNEGPVKPLHTMNELRLPWIIDGILQAGLITKEQAESEKPLQGLKILDIGCGAGIMSEPLAELGCTLVGIDPCADMIYEAKKHQALNPSLSNLTYLCEPVEIHAVHNHEKYDAVIASEVVDHVDEQEFFLDLSSRCVAPGGSLFITTFSQTWAAWFIAIVFYEYIWRIIPRGCHSWYKFITPVNVEQILNKYDCRTKSLRGMHLNFPDKTWKWTSSTSVSYALCAVKNKK